MSDIMILALGFLSQALYGARQVTQWILSEKARKVVSPTAFWVLSLVAAFLYFIYGWLRLDFAIMAGQFVGYYIYLWNLEKKQVFSKMAFPLRRLAETVIVLVPITAVTAVLTRHPETFQQLFARENIATWLLIIGVTGQALFTLRFVYQIIYSSRKGESILPFGFWVLSAIGAILLIVYAILRHDPVIFVSQIGGMVTYVRNLYLWKGNKASS